MIEALLSQSSVQIYIHACNLDLAVLKTQALRLTLSNSSRAQKTEFSLDFSTMLTEVI